MNRLQVNTSTVKEDTLKSGESFLLLTYPNLKWEVQLLTLSQFSDFLSFRVTMTSDSSNNVKESRAFQQPKRLA